MMFPPVRLMGDLPVEADAVEHLLQGASSVAIDIDIAQGECSDSGDELSRNIRRNSDDRVGEMAYATLFFERAIRCDP